MEPKVKVIETLTQVKGKVRVACEYNSIKEALARIPPFCRRVTYGRGYMMRRKRGVTLYHESVGRFRTLAFRLKDASEEQIEKLIEQVRKKVWDDYLKRIKRNKREPI